MSSRRSAGEATPTAATQRPRSNEPEDVRASRPVNPYLKIPSAPEEPPSAFGVEEMNEHECWQLVEQCNFGRFAVVSATGAPEIFPMNYLVHERSILVRSAPGGKLRSVAMRADVAFEVDGATATHYWSVVVHGAAHRLAMDSEIGASGVLTLASLSPTPKNDFLRLTPAAVTGRRFPKRRAAVPPSAPIAHDRGERNAADVGHTSTSSRQKPQPIPHRPPLRALRG